MSLLTDISAEMITAFLPVYLLFTLQLNYLQFGLLDGLYTGATALLRLVGGHAGDRWRRPKAVAAIGYGLSAMTKLAFPVAGASVAWIGALLAVDRAGKGLRTAPRDALISLAAPPAGLGRSFGVHRSMDTIGALLGPLVTFLILAELGTASGPVFVTSFCFGLIGLIVLLTFVRERRAATTGPPPSFRAGLAMLREQRLRTATIAATVLGLATISDAFIFVLLQRISEVPASVLPLLPLGTAITFLLTATSIGRVADRIGRWIVFFAGHLLLLGVYLLLLGPIGGYFLVVLVLLLHGLFYAATDGVLMAYGSALVPESLRGSGLAVLQTGQALARLGSSVGFGILLQYSSFDVAVVTAVVALVLALVVTLLLTQKART